MNYRKTMSENVLEIEEIRKGIQELVEDSIKLGIPRTYLISAISEIYAKSSKKIKSESVFNEEESYFFEKVERFVERHYDDIYNAFKGKKDRGSGETYHREKSDYLISYYKALFMAFYREFKNKGNFTEASVNKHMNEIGIKEYVYLPEVSKVFHNLLVEIYKNTDRFYGEKEIRKFYFRHYNYVGKNRVIYISLIWTILNEK